MTKEAIKQVVEAGMTIEFPYKSKINDYYSQLRFVNMDTYYRVGEINFSDIDEAVNYFLREGFTSKNKGYIQTRLMNKRNDIDEYWLENPDEELKNLFKEEGKLVDEEAKKLNINVKPFPKVEEAEEWLEKMVKELTVDNFIEKVKEFEKKYMVLDLYISTSFHYEYDDKEKGNDYGYRYSFDYEEFSLDLINEFKEKEIENMHWKCMELCVRISYSEKHRHRFSLDF